MESMMLHGLKMHTAKPLVSGQILLLLKLLLNN
jgi:hypothetical protein